MDAAAARTDRSYCTTCGWLLPAGARATCAACGGDATPLPLADNVRPVPRDDEDESALAGAREAWSQGEHARAIGLALTLGPAPRGFASPLGPGWVAASGSTPVFAVLDMASSQVTLEVPVVRLPHAKRVPAMRAALALCNDTVTASRFCLRLDLLVVRFAARLDALSPALIRSIAREMAVIAARAQEHLALAFDARPAIPEQGVLSAWDRLGRSQALPLLAPPSFTMPASQPHPASSTRPSSLPSTRVPVPTPQVALNRPITLRLSIPPVLLAEDDDDDIPAILAPDMADERPILPTMPPPPSIPPVTPRPSMLPSALPQVPALGLRPPFQNLAAARVPSETDGVPQTRRPAVRPPAQDAGTPEGKLCDLLRQALALATALSFEERPYSTLLLVRAAVYRAVLEHSEAVPNAIFYLLRATRTVTRDVWTSKQDNARGTGPIPPLAEPALAAIEQVITTRAAMPREKPASIEQWLTAQQAKQELAKYVEELQLAPTDPTLRHYLALGALSELLVRAKLPPSTDQRLREIVAYAQRDGARGPVIELMMTSLRKIVAG